VLDFSVLSYLVETLIQKHNNYYVLQYNSRGVGKSSGWASFSGFSEGQDLQDFVQWALSSLPTIKVVILMGYSHGSLITTLHPVLQLEIKTYHILLSYPLGPRAFLTAFNSSAYNDKLQALVRDPHSNVLIIYGDCDEFTGDTRYATWIGELQKQRNTVNLQVARVEGANHFWVGRSIEDLSQIIAEWVPKL